MVALFNDILQHGTLGGTQKQRIIILVPKISNPRSTTHQPITLSNMDYEILTKTLANRLKHYFAKIIRVSQKGCIPGRTILHAISTIRDVIAYKTVTQGAGCILSIDLQCAFDKVDHEYLL
jgi:hypothetical protein